MREGGRAPATARPRRPGSSEDPAMGRARPPPSRVEVPRAPSEAREHHVRPDDGGREEGRRAIRRNARATARAAQVAPGGVEEGVGLPEPALTIRSVEADAVPFPASRTVTLTSNVPAPVGVHGKVELYPETQPGGSWANRYEYGGTPPCTNTSRTVVAPTVTTAGEAKNSTIESGPGPAGVGVTFRVAFA